MKTLLTVAGLSLTFAVPSLAAPALAAKPGPSTSATADRAAPASAPALSERTRYCVVSEPFTGTRLWRKTCQTRDEWLKTGFDPLTAKVVG